MVATRDFRHNSNASVGAWPQQGLITSPMLSVLHINGGVVVRPQQPQAVPVNAQRLSEREREVLSLVAEGCSNKLIGEQLGISERTVKNHLTYIMTKLR